MIAELRMDPKEDDCLPREPRAIAELLPEVFAQAWN